MKEKSGSRFEPDLFLPCFFFKSVFSTEPLRRGISLPRGFDTRQNPCSCHYDSPNDNPVRGYMQQERAVDKAESQNPESNRVQSK
jgi:hypothetical protein